MKTDREKLIDWLNETDHTWKTSEYLADYLISRGVTIPVRCGECKHREYVSEFNVHYCIKIGVDTANDGWFCSYGERKEDEN